MYFSSDKRETHNFFDKIRILENQNPLSCFALFCEVLLSRHASGLHHCTNHKSGSILWWMGWMWITNIWLIVWDECDEKLDEHYTCVVLIFVLACCISTSSPTFISMHLLLWIWAARLFWFKRKYLVWGGFIIYAAGHLQHHHEP